VCIIYTYLFLVFHINNVPRKVSRQELVGWLQQQIAEQKRRDMSTYGSSVVPADPSSSSLLLPSKDVSSHLSDVQLVLSGDTGDAKKQRKQIKHLFLDRGKNV
jgi:translation initiation factor 2-alpha kinase 4